MLASKLYSSPTHILVLGLASTLLVSSACNRSLGPRFESELGQVYQTAKKALIDNNRENTTEFVTAISVAKDKLKYSQHAERDRKKAEEILTCYEVAAEALEGVQFTNAFYASAGIPPSSPVYSHEIVQRDQNKAKAYIERAEKLYYGQDPGPVPREGSKQGTN